MSKFIFFAGKGGVGKTSMASATALACARKGHKTLIVTTDPASNLADVFEHEIGHKTTEIVRDLFAMEISPDAATAEYKARMLEPIRQLFPDSVVKIMEEQLNSPCTAEVAAFDKFIDFMNDSEYDVVIFDTAPTGHTLRLLELPLDWKKAIEASEQGSGQTCIGSVQTLQESKAKYEKAIELMRGKGSRFIFVLTPDSTSIYETKRSIDSLAKMMVRPSLLVVNGILPEEECTDPFFKKKSEMQQKYMKQIESVFRIPILRVPLLDTEVKGLPIIERLGGMLYGSTRII